MDVTPGTWLPTVLEPKKVPGPRRDALFPKVAAVLPPFHSAPFLDPNLTLSRAMWPGQPLRLWVRGSGGSGAGVWGDRAPDCGGASSLLFSPLHTPSLEAMIGDPG